MLLTIIVSVLKIFGGTIYNLEPRFLAGVPCRSTQIMFTATEDLELTKLS